MPKLPGYKFESILSREDWTAVPLSSVTQVRCSGACEPRKTPPRFAYSVICFSICCLPLLCTLLSACFFSIFQNRFIHFSSIPNQQFFISHAILRCVALCVFLSSFCETKVTVTFLINLLDAIRTNERAWWFKSLVALFFLNLVSVLSGVLAFIFKYQPERNMNLCAKKNKEVREILPVFKFSAISGLGWESYLFCESFSMMLYWT